MDYREMNIYSSKLIEMVENPPERIHTISHTDLDGYGCESLFKQAFMEKTHTWDRSNPGKPLIESLEKALELFESADLDLLVVTDLNLTQEAYDLLSNSGHLDKVIWIDHHQTQVDWDNMWWEENSCILSSYEGEPICATSLVWGVLRYVDIENIDIFFEIGDLVSEMIRMYDTYEFKKDPVNNISFAGLGLNSKIYHSAQLLNTVYHLGGDVGRNFIDLIYATYEINKPPRSMNDLIIYGLNNIHDGIYKSLVINVLKQDADYVEKKLEKSFERSATINGHEYKFRAVFAEKLMNDVGHELMAIYPELDFVAIIGDNAISLRTERDDIDLSIIAKAFNPLGGGHKKAAGAGITPELRQIMVDTTITKALELAATE